MDPQLRQPRVTAIFPYSFQRHLCPIIVLVAVSLAAPRVLAEVRTVSAQGEYRMGDRDTKEDAVRLATESAKRNALEQVATYLESATVVEGAGMGVGSEMGEGDNR